MPETDQSTKLYGYKTNLDVCSDVGVHSTTRCIKANSNTEGVDIVSSLDIPVNTNVFIVYANCTDYDSGGNTNTYSLPLGLFQAKNAVADFLDKLDGIEQKWEEITRFRIRSNADRKRAKTLQEEMAQWQITVVDGQTFKDMGRLPWHSWGTSLNDIVVAEVILSDAESVAVMERRRKSFNVSWV